MESKDAAKRKRYRERHLEECKAHCRNYYRRNAEAIKERARRNYWAKREKWLIGQRKWYSENKERFRIRNLKYKKLHKERLKAAAVVYHKKKHSKIVMYASVWCNRNRDKIAQVQHARRFKKLSPPYEDCTDKIKLLRTSRFCHWCCRKLTPKTVTIDHVIPLNKGGHHLRDNLVAACNPCNASKSDNLIHEWLPNVVSV